MNEILRCSNCGRLFNKLQNGMCEYCYMSVKRFELNDNDDSNAMQKQIDQLQQENQQLKEQNELEFNDFVKFKKEQEDRHLEKTNKLIKENYHLKKQIKQNNEVIDELTKHIQSLSSKGRDCMIYADVKKDILDILKKYKKVDD